MKDIGNQADEFFADIRSIEKNFGLNSTYSYDNAYPEFEIYNVLPRETV
jgi:hypothetical protein